MHVTLSLPPKIVELAKKRAHATGATFSGLVRVSLEKNVR